MPKGRPKGAPAPAASAPDDGAFNQDASEPLGSGRQLRVRQPKAYQGHDDDVVVDEEEGVTKKGRKRGRPPKNAPKSTPRPQKKALPPPTKLRPVEPPVAPEKLDEFRCYVERLPDDAILHNLQHLLPESTPTMQTSEEPSSVPNSVSEKPSSTTPEPSVSPASEETTEAQSDALAVAPSSQAECDDLVLGAAEAAEAAKAGAPVSAQSSTQQVVTSGPGLKVPSDAVGHLLQVSGTIAQLQLWPPT